ncbi:MAG: glycosyltransferase family 39 protein [Victivallales bacterium]
MSGFTISENKRIFILFALTILLSMLINVFHPYLWGPDEPRVAEIARETYISGNYITPHFHGLPFIEKPPLYFDMAAFSYIFAGGPCPGAARLVSALFGCIMLGVAFLVGCNFGGLRSGALATAILIGMPQFYRTAHWIVTDIGVGAFCALALVLFMYYAFQPEDKKAKWPLYLFYLVSAGAFLTKGLVAISHIGIIIGAFILLWRKWDLLGRALYPPAMLMFLIPVGIWVYLFYKEGGGAFLHEHFINNTIGRFLHISLKTPEGHFAYTDIGNDSPWYFYLARLPNMFGGAIALLPFIIWDSLLKLDALPGKWILYPDKLEVKKTGRQSTVIKFFLFLLNGNSPSKPYDAAQKDRILFLFLWAFLPLFLFSFSAIKEVTYILPSYVAIAIMCGKWLNERIKTTEELKKTIPYFISIVIPAAFAAALLAPFFPPAYIIAVSVWMGGFILLAAASLLKMRFERAAFVICGIILCGIILGNTPEVMRKTRLNRKCHIDLAKYVFPKVGDKRLYVCGGCETLRGSMLFYGNSRVIVSNGAGILKKALPSSEGDFFIIINRHLKQMRAEDKELAAMLKHCREEELQFNLSDDYTLICSPAKTVKCTK